MERWIGKTAVITGASSGIGAFISEKFVKSGINVVGLARRMNLLEELAEKLSSEVGKFHPLKCDVSMEENILEAFSWIEENLGGISIMVNNAGIFMPTTILNGDPSMWKATMNINVMGTCICTKEAIKSMKNHDIDGQIINIGSISGHYVPYMDPPCLNIYSSSKHSIRAITETLRRELRYYESKIKISCISPGLVETDFLGDGDDSVVHILPALKAEDVAEVAMFILSSQPHCQIHDVIIRAVGEKL